MARSKHVPQRTCIICRTVKPKRELIRIVRTPERALRLDRSGKMPGRGAYLCQDMRCWQDNALSRKKIEHALKFSITTEDWSATLAVISELKLTH